MEKIIYRSKMSKWLVVFIAIVIIGIAITMIIVKAWPAMILDVLLFGLFAYLFNTTDYTVDGSTLKVRSGFIINITIDIATITKIEPTNSVLSAPALSFDRLEVFYNKYDSVVISPKDKAGFIAKLQEINPGIVVK